MASPFRVRSDRRTQEPWLENVLSKAMASTSLPVSCADKETMASDLTDIALDGQ
jgi:hypothetical protein